MDLGAEVESPKAILPDDIVMQKSLERIEIVKNVGTPQTEAKSKN